MNSKYNFKNQIVLVIIIQLIFTSCSRPTIYYAERFYNIQIDDFDYRIDDTLVNECIKVYDNKDSTIRYVGCFKNSQKDGVWKSYNSAGVLFLKYKYKNGKKEGIQKVWYHTGNPKIIWVSKDGIVKRVLKCYNPDGEKISFEEFKDWQY